MSGNDEWRYLSGYVAEMVRAGSVDAVGVLEYMIELKPGTEIFTRSITGDDWKRHGEA